MPKKELVIEMNFGRKLRSLNVLRRKTKDKVGTSGRREKKVCSDRMKIYWEDKKVRRGRRPLFSLLLIGI